MLNCVDCGRQFVFSSGEQRFYEQKGFQNKPNRCPDCRQARKQMRTSGGTAATARGVRARCSRRRAASAAAWPRFRSTRAAINRSIAGIASLRGRRIAEPTQSQSPLSASYDAVIIGAGHNGLACAALLAQRRTFGRGLRAARRRSAAPRSARPTSGRDIRFRRRRTCAACSTRGWSRSSICAIARPVVLSQGSVRVHAAARRAIAAARHRSRKQRARDCGVRSARRRRVSRPTSSAPIGWGRRSSTRSPTTIRASSASMPQTQRLLRGSAADLVERYVSTPVLQAELVNDGLIGTYLGPRDAGNRRTFSRIISPAACSACKARGPSCAAAWDRFRSALASAAVSHGAEIFSDAAVTRIVVDDERRCGVERIDVGGDSVRAARGRVERASADDLPRLARPFVLDAEFVLEGRGVAERRPVVEGESRARRAAELHVPTGQPIRSRTIAPRFTSRRRSITCRRPTTMRERAARARSR